MLSVHQMLTEQDDEKWPQDADVDEGKMHRLLNVPEDEQIEDHYDDGKKLADDLVAATGDESEAASMINYAANLTDSQVLKDAQDAIKEKDYET